MELCGEAHLQKFNSIQKEIESAAKACDVNSFNNAVNEYIEASLEASDNKVLIQILSDLLPALKRIHFLSLSDKTRNLIKNADYFKKLTNAINSRDKELGVLIIREYMISEMEYVLKILEKNTL
ncbi:MAG: FCD domain-containing protein [Desulfobacteraceae bacterium]|nr:FCD domain-containing protein [Desulfobacteraceae bacterium]MCB9493973.1 FCD domain-containing protein [Desulfobacteraceae bacterium]